MYMGSEQWAWHFQGMRERSVSSEKLEMDETKETSRRITLSNM